MNNNFSLYKPRKLIGKCYVCKRSTKLAVHSACGRKNDSKRTKGNEEATKRHYHNGYLPSWMYS